MYNLSDEQIQSVETFIGKLEDSMVKSHIEKWLAEIRPTARITTEQMEKFVSFSTHLPIEVQNFPQSFAMAVKNTPNAEKDNADVNLTAIASDSIAEVEDVSAPNDEEETEHKLNTKKGSTGGKPMTKPSSKK